MAAKYAFRDFLDDALRDSFVTGLRNPAVLAALLQKKELNFETASELARVTELAEKSPRFSGRPRVALQEEGSVRAVSKSAGHNTTIS